jgi:3-phenylpropionate/trans-cinnamate dioxygenase ferredoxin subunit
LAGWTEVARVTEFSGNGEEEVIRVELEGHPLALFKLEDGLFALDDICSHEYSRLSEGEIWDDEVYCPKHGSRFNIHSGAVRGLPAVKPVGSYPVKVEDGRILVLWQE